MLPEERKAHEEPSISDLEVAEEVARAFGEGTEIVIERDDCARCWTCGEFMPRGYCLACLREQQEGMGS